ncbi:hypothetical protein Y032_0005g2481 [Ancylostoma ceylanicum]|uniref:Uncharacterized protein n=1 Tax=Ancylostoma ceylanicum TaxID=53326 RepID=A0A016VS71_9BILA|nr:hypothetical protein Y032_0005g2481 [Ancylostoma ceylanicum]
MREKVHLHPFCRSRIIHKGLIDRIDQMGCGLMVVVSLFEETLPGSIPGAGQVFASLFHVLFSFENLFYAIL